MMDSALAVGSGTGRRIALGNSQSIIVKLQSDRIPVFLFTRRTAPWMRQLVGRCRLVKHRTPYKAFSESHDDAGGLRFCGPDLSVLAPNLDRRFPVSGDADLPSPPQSEVHP